MFKNLLSTKPIASISLFLGMDRLALCIREDEQVTLLAQSAISSDSQWTEKFDSWVNEFKLQKYQVSVVLSRDFYQTFDIEKPKVADAELLASLPFAIKDLITDSIFDVVVDYYDRPLMPQKGEMITAVCIAKHKVLQIRDMLLKHNMRIKEITIEELALAQLLGKSEDVNLLLSQQSNELILTVVKNGQLFFTHRLRGFNDLLLRPFNEVEEELLDSLSLELQRVLDYINSQLRLTSIAHLYLALICQDIDVLSEKLALYLAKNVVPFGEKDQYDFNNILPYGLLMEGKGQ